MTWLSASKEIVAKGVTAKKATCLGDLHRRRQEAEGQFFTPTWVSKEIWRILKSSLPSEGNITVADTSIGSGRLLEHAPTDRAMLYGVDTDDRCIEALRDEAAAAGIHYEFLTGGLEDLHISGFSIAVINPPFSITLQSPNLEPYDCTAYGPYGPSTSTLSHEYALEQALKGASVVVALLPISMDTRCRKNKRLKAIFNLPRKTFKSEGAESVSTAVYLFDSTKYFREVQTFDVSPGLEWPIVPLSIKPSSYSASRFRLNGLDLGKPVITTPLTGDNRVELHHHNRRIILKFHDGLTEAKVLNGILEAPVSPGEKHRYPKNVKHIGDGRLLLDSYLLQDDPDKSFNDFIQSIVKFGGIPQVSKTLSGYFSKLVKQHMRASTPFRHWVKRDSSPSVTLVAKRRGLLEQGNIASPSIRRGQEVSAIPLGGAYRIELDGWEVELRRDEAQRLFELPESDVGFSSTGWELVHPGLNVAFPHLYEQTKSMLLKAGVTWLWPYQIDSVSELLMKPNGDIAAWKQGTGKARAVLALAARKLYVLDGTPYDYPRNILPITALTAGNGRAHQPYSLHNGPYLEKRILTSASFIDRGVNAFIANHVVLEWATHEFKDTLSTGAKREIPQINNLPLFRSWLAPNVQRRTKYEPEVEPYAGCPKPSHNTLTLKWDNAHLKHYLKCALEFSEWYIAERKSAEGKHMNLIEVLARIRTVINACDNPAFPSKDFPLAYSPTTSKERWAIDRLTQLSNDGVKTIIYVTSPSEAERLGRLLENQNIESVIFHGKKSIKNRVQALDEEFRFGTKNILISTWVGQRGLNIPEGKHVIMYSRNWSGNTEDQAIERTQRPEQDQSVMIEYPHLEGSINEYMAQVVEWKLAASDEGLDWGDGATESEVFFHMDHILYQFAKDTLGMSPRDALKHLAA